MRRAYWAALLSAALAACGLLETAPPQPAPTRPPTTPAAGTPPPASLHPGSRWLPVAWSELPGWEGDHTREAWVALQRSCERLPAEVQRDAPAWQRVCQDALRSPPADDASARAWLLQRLLPYRVLPLEASAPAEGLATGYFEPQIDASRTPRVAFRVPLHAPPADLATRRP